MDEAQVITVADHDGWVTYYVFPAEEAEEIVDLDDLFDKVEESDSVKEFRSPIDFAEWHCESDVELTSYWETRQI